MPAPTSVSTIRITVPVAFRVGVVVPMVMIAHLHARRYPIRRRANPRPHPELRATTDAFATTFTGENGRRVGTRR
jgi:hypothetical protein